MQLLLVCRSCAAGVVVTIAACLFVPGLACAGAGETPLGAAVPRKQTDNATLALRARHDQAMAFADRGEYREARALLLDVEARWHRSRASNDTPAWLDQSMGVVLLRLAEPAAAEERLRAAADKSLKMGDSARAAAIDVVRAQALMGLRRLDEAEALLAAVKQLPPGAYTHVTPATVQAAAWLMRRNDHEAAEVIDAELARLRKVPAAHARVLFATLRVAVAVHLESDVARARQLANEALSLARRRARSPQKSADVGEAELLLARVERRAGHDDEARRTAARAATSLANGLGADHPLTQAARALAAR